MRDDPGPMDYGSLRDDGGNLDPGRVAHAIDETGAAWASRSQAAFLLEKTKDAVLSRLTLGFRDQGFSLREADLRAKASDEWEIHVYAIADARHAAALARVRHEAVKALFEAGRTVESTRRAEISAFGRR